MTFPFVVYLLAFGSALLATLALVPWVRRVCQRLGLVDDPGHRKIHHTPVPLAGGIAVFAGLLIASLGGVLAVRLGIFDASTDRLLDYGLGRRALPFGAILLGALGMVLLGFWDDRYELKAGPKFAGQILIALLVAMAGVRITLFVPSLLFSYAITVLWLVTITNAFNFMDNMNGLCAGVGAIAAGWFAISAGIHGQYLVALLALFVCGALVGYLPYNYPKASVFLGDAGSHLVGFLCGVLAILPHFHTLRQPNPWAVLIPLAILLVPLADLVSVVIIRTRRRQPFWIGDTNHFSHRLVRAGFGKPQAVAILWAVSLVAGAVCLL